MKLKDIILHNENRRTRFFSHITGATALTLFLLTFCSCGSSTDKMKEDKDNVTAARDSTPQEEGLISLSQQQMDAVGITIGEIEKMNLSAVVKANGELAVPPQNMAMVSTLSGGIIQKIKVLEGQEVKKGQVLATIENQELLKIQQDYLAAKNSFVYVEAEYKRQTALQAGGAGTGKFFQSASANYNTEQSRLKAYESQLRQLGISPVSIAGGKIVSQFPLLAPIKGTVGTISATTGSFAQPGMAIMEVVDNSKIHCDLIIFEKDLNKVKTGQAVNFQLTNQDNRQIKGRINGINKSFENESKGVIVHAVIENPAKSNLIPGMYVTALISVGTEMVNAVPVEAVVSIEGKRYIYLVAEDKDSAAGQFQFTKLEVATGIAELGYIQIKPLGRLDDNSQIVKKGAFYLQSKASGAAEEE